MIPFAESCLEVLRSMHDTIKLAIADLPQEALVWAPGEEMNTLAVLITHTAGAERYWIGTMIGGISSGRVRADEFDVAAATVEKLNGLLDEALSESLAVVKKLELEDLQKMVLSPPHKSKFRVGWSLLHTIEHTANHVGHIEMTRQLWDQKDR